ncbi:MAG: hypothetical protein JSV03_03830, partial [Planctomycetota bacterium]
MFKLFLEGNLGSFKLLGLILALFLLYPMVAWADGPFPPIWQLGEYFADVGEFNPNLNNTEYIYDIVGGGGQGPFPIPKYMSGPYSNSCQRLRLRFQLSKGCYAFVRSVKEPAVLTDMLGQVFFNGRELACFFTTPLPHYSSPVIPGGDTCESSAGLYTTYPNSRLLCAPEGFQCIAFPF